MKRAYNSVAEKGGLSSSPWKNPCSINGELLRFGHLGGTSTTGDPDSWYPELWSWLIQEFKVVKMLDVGCGVGFTQDFFSRQGVFSYGIDAEPVLARHLWKDSAGEADMYLSCHDFTRGCLLGWGKKFDLVWCCEVAEHIEEQFVNHIVRTLALNTGKVLGFCAAPKGAGGHHHVNCQNPPYWIDKLCEAGLVYQSQMSDEARGFCTEVNGRSANNYFRRSGLIFTAAAG